jgi:hypothetical protein
MEEGSLEMLPAIANMNSSVPKIGLKLRDTQPGVERCICMCVYIYITLLIATYIYIYILVATF